MSTSLKLYCRVRNKPEFNNVPMTLSWKNSMNDDTVYTTAMPGEEQSKQLDYYRERRRIVAALLRQIGINMRLKVKQGYDDVLLDMISCGSK